MTMDEKDLEALLRRYRPADPPPALRERCVAGAAVEPARSAWPWAAAAAALLAGTIGLGAAAARLDAPVATAPDWTAQAIGNLAALLGGDEAAWRAATIIVVEEERQEPQ
ncbi:MAG: hypothetical protein ACRD1S_02630 [Vicinamibacterales bacterium]